MIQRVKNTKYFEPIWKDLDGLLDPSTFVGRAPQQTEKFINNDVKKALEPFKQFINDEKVSLNV